MNISILQRGEGLAYAASELTFFLNQYTNATVTAAEGGEHTVSLTVDGGMPAHHYRLHGDGKNLIITGGSASAVQCGVYEALSRGGLLFLATGYSAPCGFSLETFLNANGLITPKFRLRGIRQHINFPMDISSYPLREAKEYIRAIARMQYNTITFHTYPGQWHETRPDDPSNHAGHFFYGQVHPLPADNPLLVSRINNRKYYCIPEVEPIYEDEAARADFARYWLREVMATAKEVGLTITLSVEILDDDETATDRMLHVICETYPQIDTLELITEECGGFRDQPGVDSGNIKEFVVSLFGEDVLDAEGNLPGLPPLPDNYPHQLPSSAASLKRLLNALERRETWTAGLEHTPALRAGLYLTCPDTLRVLRPIIRRKRPADTTMSLLPAHGALAVARNIADTGNTEEDWQNTMYYSWAEFDGNMFLQQMSTDGLQALVEMPEAESAYGFCINHWRTAENNLTIAYAAEAARKGTTAEEFYRSYARRLGIGDEAGFARACGGLAWLDTYNRDNLFNIGFCAVVCWINWHKRGDGMMPRGYAAEPQIRSMEEYGKLVEAFESLLPSATTPEGIGFLRLMANRCETSILHIRAMKVLDELGTLYDYDNPKPLTDARMARVQEILTQSMDAAWEYLRVYGDILPDRGGEGQLISYYETTIFYIRAVMATFDKTPVVSLADTYDAPPMPDAEVK